MQPVCFVLMPEGDPEVGGAVDFSSVYEEAVRPAIVDAGLVPVRDPKASGVPSSPTLERLLASDYAVIDVTRADAGEFYAIGARHALKPGTTALIAARDHAVPERLAFPQTLLYETGGRGQFGSIDAETLRRALSDRLRGGCLPGERLDPALLRLLGRWPIPEISRLKTDIFRDHVQLPPAARARLAEARAIGGGAGLERLRAFEVELGPLGGQPFAVLVDLLLSYRAVEAWADMVRLVDSMPIELRRQVLVREQLAFALNRRAGDTPLSDSAADRDREMALALLAEVEREQGPSGESSALIGRIHKDEWERARRDPGRSTETEAHLDAAIAAYTRGFEADSRDAFPGINAVTLLDVRGDEASLRLRDELLPVVRYAVRRRLGRPDADYWDHATLLELAVVASDEVAAIEALRAALAAVREAWEPASTARNLALLREARESRETDVGWISDVIVALEERAAGAV